MSKQIKAPRWRRFDAQIASNKELNEAIRLANQHYKYNRQLEKLMDCRDIQKFDGHLGCVPRPERRRVQTMLSYAMAASYFQSGAIILHDVKNQIRIVVFDHKIVGVIRNDVFKAITNKTPHVSRFISGTNYMAYRKRAAHA